MPGNRSGATNQPRPYRSSVRAQAAADTRRTILDTAMRLFVERGYGQVTVADIADGASVALPTVYASTGGKAAILSTLIDEAMGDPVVEQTLNAMAASRSGEEVIELTAQGVRTDNERYHAIVQIMKTAAAVDATATQILVRSDDVYREALGQVTRRLGSLGRLKAGVTEWQATDILWFYLGREAWHILVADRRWSWDDAAQWLTQQVSAALLDPPEPPTADAPPRS